MTLANLAAYSAQVLAVVAAAAAVAALARVPAARARVAFWRLIVATCLLLPLAAARPSDVVLIPPAGTLEMTLLPDTLESVASEMTPAWSPTALVLTVLVAGAAVRVAWVGLGLLALARLRRQSEPAAVGEAVEALKAALAPHADIRRHDRIAQPVTFSYWRPVVLLPRRLGELSLDAQRAVACHELLHVARRDWLWTLAEEAVRCAFWFHPAMWYALEQLQVSREQVVDEEVVRLTSARQSYLRALVEFAGSGEPAATAALPFVRRRHLVSRIRQLSEAGTMTRVRAAATVALMFGVISASTWAAAAAMPLAADEPIVIVMPDSPTASGPVTAVQDVSVISAAGPVDVRAREIEPGVAQPAAAATAASQVPGAATLPRATRRVAPEYPAEASGHHVEAVVVVHVVVGANGAIQDVDVVRTRLATDGDIDDPAYWSSQPSRAFAEAAERAAWQWEFEPPARDTTVEIAFAFVPSQRLARYAVAGPGGTRVALPAELPAPPPPPPPAPTALPPAPVVGSATPGVIPQPPPPPPAPARIRVGGNIRQPTKIADARPEYPLEAKAAGVQGVVIVETVIGVDGSVIEAKLLRSIPLLGRAALDAVRQWKFVPTLLNGAPAEVVMVVTVNFALDR